MKRRRKTQRRLVRLRLKMLAKRHPDRRADIQQVLDTPDMFDAVVAHAEVLHLEASSGSRLSDFFEWLIENGPALLDFITKLIAVFAAA
ncbi:MAG: hypothetical protein ABGX16_14975 [Pirellulales bacterium]